MRISVTRTGGLAGRTVHAALDTTGHPDAGRLHALAERALADGGGGPDGGAHGGGAHGGVPDGYRYEITAGGRVVRCADPGLTDAQRELVRRVLDAGAGAGTGDGGSGSGSGR